MSGRAAAVVYYTAGLVTNILKGMRDTADLAWRCTEDTDARLESAMAHVGKLQDLPIANLVATMGDIEADEDLKSTALTEKCLDGRNQKGYA